MWKLPMFGCTDSGAVLAEVARCSKAFPQAYIRLVRSLTSVRACTTLGVWA
jgi:ribulose bisphosphate carboxylase small subunit